MGIYQGSKLMSGGGGGPSPYEIAKQNGYTGTEQEFNQLLAALDQNATEQELNNKADLVNGKVPAEQVDTYTKTEANTLLQNKADTSSVYTKAEADTLLQNKLGGIESTDYPGCYYRLVNGVVEWFNPPMLINNEYRTTERYMGNPVYVRLVDCGTFTASASPTLTNIPVDTVANMGSNFRIISCESAEYIDVLDQRTSPFVRDSLGVYVNAGCWWDSQNIRQWGVSVYYEKITEPYHVYAIVKYTY